MKSFGQFFEQTLRFALLYSYCAWDGGVEPKDFVSQIIHMCSDERLHDPSTTAC